VKDEVAGGCNGAAVKRRVVLHAPAFLLRHRIPSEQISGRGDGRTGGGVIRDGRLRGIAVTTATRTDALPDVPAISEFVPGYEAAGWYGICAPAGTPADIVAKLAAAIVTAGGDATFKSRLVALGVESTPMTTAQFSKFVADEIDKWAKVVKFAAIKAD